MARSVCFTSQVDWVHAAQGGAYLKRPELILARLFVGARCGFRWSPGCDRSRLLRADSCGGMADHQTWTRRLLRRSVRVGP